MVKAKQQQAMTDRYFAKKLVLMKGRGQVKRPVRQSHRKARQQLRAAESVNSHWKTSVIRTSPPVAVTWAIRMITVWNQYLIRYRKCMALQPGLYDPQVEDIKAWVLLCVDMGDADSL